MSDSIFQWINWILVAPENNYTGMAIVPYQFYNKLVACKKKSPHHTVRNHNVESKSFHKWFLVAKIIASINGKSSANLEWNCQIWKFRLIWRKKISISRYECIYFRNNCNTLLNCDVLLTYLVCNPGRFALWIQH